MAGNSKLLLGFAAGLIAGAGVYAFLKSEKGQQFMEDVKDNLDHMKDELKKYADKGKEMAADLKDKFNGTDPASA